MILSMKMTDMKMREQVRQALGADVYDFDVPMIVDKIQAEYGTSDVNDVPAAEFWEIVNESAR